MTEYRDLTEWSVQFSPAHATHHIRITVAKSTLEQATRELLFFRWPESCLCTGFYVRLDGQLIKDSAAKEQLSDDGGGTFKLNASTIRKLANSIDIRLIVDIQFTQHQCIQPCTRDMQIYTFAIKLRRVFSDTVLRLAMPRLSTPQRWLFSLAAWLYLNRGPWSLCCHSWHVEPPAINAKEDTAAGEVVCRVSSARAKQLSMLETACRRPGGLAAERAWGFGVGVSASIIAGLVIWILERMVNT